MEIKTAHDLVSVLTEDDIKYLSTLRKYGPCLPWRSREYPNLYQLLRTWPASHSHRVRRRLERMGYMTSAFIPPPTTGSWRHEISLTDRGLAAVGALIALGKLPATL